MSLNSQTIEYLITAHLSKHANGHKVYFCHSEHPLSEHTLSHDLAIHQLRNNDIISQQIKKKIRLCA